MGNTILLVDDMSDIRKMVRASLEQLGYCVVEAVDGKDAVEVVARAPATDFDGLVHARV